MGKLLLFTYLILIPEQSSGDSTGQTVKLSRGEYIPYENFPGDILSAIEYFCTYLYTVVSLIVTPEKRCNYKG